VSKRPSSFEALESALKAQVSAFEALVSAIEALPSAMKKLLFWLVMAVTALLVWAVVKSSTGEQIRTLTFTQFSQEIARDNVRDVTVLGSEIAGIFSVRGVLMKGGIPFRTGAPANYTDWIKALSEKNVSVTFDVQEHSGWLRWLANGLPMLFLLGLLIYFMRVMQKGARGRWPSPPTPP
jgi:cell division protease FtsH